MALADTAELAVRLSLDDRFSRGIDGVNRRLGNLEKGVNRVGRGVSTTARVMGTFGGIVLERVVSGGINAVTGAIHEGTIAFGELEAVTQRTAGALKSTRAVSGQTAAGIRELAQSMEDLTTFDDKAIQGAENMLLTFTNIRKDAFKPALQAVLDLNAALGGGNEGLQGNAIKVGRALADPTKGLNALTRAGVQFSAAQVKRIKDLQKEGKLYQAQQIILRELNKEFGGQGAIFGKGADADARRLKDSVEELQIVFARGLAPAIKNIRDGLTKAFSNPQTISAIGSLADKIASFITPGNVQKGIDTFVGGMKALASIDLRTIGDALKITGQAAKVAVDAFLSLPPDIQKIAIAAIAINKLGGGIPVALATKGIEALLGGLKTIVAGNVTVVGGNVTGAGIPGAAAAAGGIGAGAIAAVSIAAIAPVVLVGLTEAILGGPQAVLDRQREGRQATIDARSGGRAGPVPVINVGDRGGRRDPSAAFFAPKTGGLSPTERGEQPGSSLGPIFATVLGPVRAALAKIVVNTGRTPSAIENFRRAQATIAKSQQTVFGFLAHQANAEKPSRTVVPVIRNLVHSLTSGSTPWAKSLSVSQHHLANLRDIERAFRATGDVHTANAIKGQIRILQHRVDALKAQQGTKLDAVKGALGAVKGAVQRVKTSVNVTVNTRTNVAVTSRSVTRSTSASARYGYNTTSRNIDSGP